MATTKTFAGQSFNLPQNREPKSSNWGTETSNFLIALADNAIPKTGGNYTLLAELNFGATYGVVAPYVKSSGSNLATAGVVRLANEEIVAWRNSANNGNHELTVTSGNILAFNGARVLVNGGPLGTPSIGDLSNCSGLPLLSGTTGTVTIARGGTGATSLSAGVVYSTGSALTTESALSTARGGTGQTSAANAYAALSPLTTKGDIQTYSTTTARLAVGSNGQVLTADSAETTGLKWTSPLTNPMDGAGQLIYGGTAGAATKLAAGSSGQYLKSNGSSAPTWSAVDLASASVTGVLPLANGGSGKNLTAAAGGLVYTDADSMEVTSAGTSSQWVLSGGTSAPTMSDTTTRAKTFQVSSGLPILLQTVATNSTDKEGSLSCGHYTNSEEPLTMIHGYSSTSTGEVYLGGGFGSGNAATVVRIYAAANNTTTVGTGQASFSASAVTLGAAAGTTQQLNTINSYGAASSYSLTINERNSASDGIVKLVGAMTSGTFSAFDFRDGDGTQCGSVNVNTTANTTAYATSSDARLKQNPVAFDGLAVLSQIDFKQYNRIADPTRTEYGVYAQELYETLPQAVVVGGEDPDDKPWSVDYGQLTPVLGRALQQQQLLIEAMAARIAALEATQ